MASSVGSITFDCANPYQLAQFWAAVLDYQVEGGANDEEVEVADPASRQTSLLFIRVPEGKAVKNRIHLDLIPTTSRNDEVERLLKLGARYAEDFKGVGGSNWTVLLDPEGNEFCVVRSQQERNQQK